jgi:hypothetical protein
MQQERDGERSGSRPGYSQEFQARVGQKLRQSYRADEPQPDAFSVLLDRLARIAT